MPLDEDTRREIEASLQGQLRLHPDYEAFLVKWLVFNRAYSNLEEGKDHEKVLAVGERLQSHWGEIQHLAVQLASLECIGSKRVIGFRLLKPDTWIKSATLYLRKRLDMQPAADIQGCGLAACRPEKRELCGNVRLEPWNKGEMAALLRLVYQVRCNLVHGDKRLHGQDIQTDRDRELISISTQILEYVLQFILWEEIATTVRNA